MENTVNEANNTFSKIASKFILILKLKSEALCSPTFSPQIIDQLTKIFNQIQEYREKIESSENCDQLLFQKISIFIPDLEELIDQNYLQFTILNFQAKINEAYTVFNEALNSISDNNNQFDQIMNSLKQIISKSYTCNLSSSSCTYFIDLQVSLNKLKEDLISLQNTNENESNSSEKNTLTIIQNLSENLQQSSSILSHLISSLSFITKTYSLIKSVRKVQKNNTNKNLPLQSHKIFICPSKPKIKTETYLNGTDQINVNLDSLINEFQSDPESQSKINEYSTKFNQCLAKEFKFPPPTIILQNILRSFLSVTIQEDATNEYLEQLSFFFQKVSSLILFYYQLPNSIQNSSEISDFINQTNEFETLFNDNKLELNQFCNYSFRDFLIYCKFIKSAAEAVDKVNEILGENLAFLNLRPLKLLIPGRIISYVEYQKMTENKDKPNNESEMKSSSFNRVNAFRSLNAISQDMVTLRDRGIDIVPDPMMCEIHPVSILPQIIRLRDSIRVLEQKLFHHFQFKFGEVNDTSFLNIFNEVQKEAEEIYSFITLNPLSGAELRIKTILLYQQQFPIICEESVQNLLNFYSLTYDIYSTFCKLDEIGTIPISSSIHLSYILTMCDDLADHYKCFNKYLEFFNSINLFHIENDKIIKYFSNLKKDLNDIIAQFSFDDLINDILSYSDVIVSASSKLKEILSDNDTITLNLFDQLFLWVEGDADYRSKSNIKELQIRMEALKERITEKGKNDSEFKNSFQFNEILTVCDLFSKLRDRVEEKNRAQSLISFIEYSQDFSQIKNIQIDKMNEIASNLEFSSENEKRDKKEEKETAKQQVKDESNLNDNSDSNENKETKQTAEIENNQQTETTTNQNNESNESKNEKIQSPQKQQPASPHSSISSSNKKTTTVFTNEKASKIWFSKYLSSICEQNKQKEVIDYISPSLIYSHFIEIVTKYSRIFSLGDSFIQNVNEAFEKMVKEPINKSELTKEELLEYFMSNNAQFKQFMKNVKQLIMDQFDHAFNQMNELSSSFKNRDTHFTDTVKNLNSIRSSFKFKNFDCLKTIIQCHQDIFTVWKENASSTSHLLTTLSSLRKLIHSIYYFFMVQRCFKSLSSNRIPCEVDTSFHLILLNNFSESDHIIPESSSVNFQNQIEFILKSEIGSNSLQLETNMKILNLFGRIVNLPLILNTIESEFFDFEKFFLKIPPQVTNLQILINSALFSSANYIHNSLFDIISSTFSYEKYENAINAFDKLKSELISSPFNVEMHSIDEVINAFNSLVDLYQIAIIDDSLNSFCSNSGSSKALILGFDVFSLRVKMASFQSRLFKLTKIIPDQYNDIFRSFILNFSETFLVPDRFGRYDEDDQFFTNFGSSWSNFVSSIAPVNLSDVYDRLRHSTRIIISALNESTHKDIITLKGIEQLFATTHNPSLIFKLNLSFSYVKKQLNKYTKSFKESDLPFNKVEESLRVLMIHNEFANLVVEITNLVNRSFNLQNIISCLSTFSIDYEIENSEKSVENKNEKLLPNQLSLSDQNSLAQMIHIISAANQKDEERLSGLPMLVDEVNELSDQVKEAQKPIDQLIQIDAYMSELLDIISDQTPSNKDDNDDSNELSSKEKQAFSNSDILKRDVADSTQFYHSMMHQYEDTVKMSLSVDAENKLLLNDIIIKFGKYLNIINKKKSEHYSMHLSQLIKSYDIIRKAYESTILISNDQYTKNEFDSLFNKSLIMNNKNQNPINLELIYLKEKSFNLLKKESSNPQENATVQNMNPNMQIEILEKTKNQLINEIAALRSQQKA